MAGRWWLTPSYSGGRDQDDCGLKSPQAKNLQDPILKNPSQKRAGDVARGLGPEFKPPYCKKKKKKTAKKKYFDGEMVNFTVNVVTIKEFAVTFWTS
jgi:hypothetical protein